LAEPLLERFAAGLAHKEKIKKMEEEVATPTATFPHPATHAAQVQVSTGVQPSPATLVVSPTEANETTVVPVTAVVPQPTTQGGLASNQNGTTAFPVTAVLPQPATQGVAQVQSSTGVPPSTTAQVVNPSQQSVLTKPTYQDIAAIALNNDTKRIDADKEVGLKRIEADKEVTLKMMSIVEAVVLSLSKKRGHAEVSNGGSDSDDMDRKPSHRS
jgi:hypothetical protein